MKAVTEFANVTLNMGLKAKNALTAEGKTPEEIQTSLGETFKMEGEKLGYFIAALDVAAGNPENLKRVMVVKLAEGEKPPAKATNVGEVHFVPDFHVTARSSQPQKDGKDGKRGGRGGRGGGRGGDRGDKKESPWGLSPEEKAAKAAKSAAAAKPAKPS